MTFPLEADAVHVWRVSLDLPEEERAQCGGMLSEEERQRSLRFLREQDRNRYIVSHAALRALLSRYENLPPSRVPIVSAPGGKPRLAAGELRFNLSHSGACALIGVARGRELGIDVEQIRQEFDFEPVSERFFTDRERKELRRHTGHERRRAFFQVWTCKESFLKALGDGLGRSPSSVSIHLPRNARSVALETPGDPTLAHRWSVQILDADPGHAAALTAAGTGWRTVTRAFRFDP